MSKSASTARGKAAAAKSRAKLPKNLATIRRAHLALHNFTEQLQGELQSAITKAKSRQLNAARYVEQICRFLMHRHPAQQSATSVVLESPPTDFTVDSNFVIGLKSVDLLALAKRVDAWSAAIAALADYEGKQFDRKPISLRKRTKKRGSVAGDQQTPEGEALSTLEREADLLLGIFRDVAAKFERRLSAASPKRNRTQNEPVSQLTPPQIAKRLGVAADKVRSWIRNSELPATNVASAAATRPRWRIDEKDLAEFETRRQPAHASPTKKRKRRNGSSKPKDYF